MTANNMTNITAIKYYNEQNSNKFETEENDV
jgi:hypothetical protein